MAQAAERFIRPVCYKYVSGSAGGPALYFVLVNFAPDLFNLY